MHLICLHPELLLLGSALPNHSQPSGKLLILWHLHACKHVLAGVSTSTSGCSCLLARKAFWDTPRTDCHVQACAELQLWFSTTSHPKPPAMSFPALHLAQQALTPRAVARSYMLLKLCWIHSHQNLEFLTGLKSACLVSQISNKLHFMRLQLWLVQGVWRSSSRSRSEMTSITLALLFSIEFATMFRIAQHHEVHPHVAAVSASPSLALDCVGQPVHCCSKLHTLLGTAECFNKHGTTHLSWALFAHT